jgi:hypothetical protein
VNRPAEGLRELHEAYVWKVNAAVGEGRDDLVWRLVDEYTDQALRLMTAEHGTACDRRDCAMCHRPAPPAKPPAGWYRRLFPRR